MRTVQKVKWGGCLWVGSSLLCGYTSLIVTRRYCCERFLWLFIFIGATIDRERSAFAHYRALSQCKFGLISMPVLVNHSIGERVKPAETNKQQHDSLQKKTKYFVKRLFQELFTLYYIASYSLRPNATYSKKKDLPRGGNYKGRQDLMVLFSMKLLYKDFFFTLSGERSSLWETFQLCDWTLCLASLMSSAQN